mmetsp:Transcript_88083/g.235667  ORF Transcript_88083/g.235667 Transcript_88083/m.235667 type:complete len:267 (+) Transcript_88083:30-830(+)
MAQPAQHGKFDTADAVANLERVYKTPDICKQRAKMMEVLALRAGESLLDVGCGPGFFLEDAAKAVGPSGRLAGVDPSDAMVEAAKSRLGGNSDVQVAGADNLPFEDGTFDAIVFCQVLCYIPDVVGALVEARRVLKPTGRILILETDFGEFTLFSSDPDRVQRVISRLKGMMAHTTLPRQVPMMMQKAGLRIQAADAIALMSVGTTSTESWIGNMILGSFPKMAADKPDPDHPTDSEDFLEEQKKLSEAGHFFGSGNRFLFLGVPA